MLSSFSILLWGLNECWDVYSAVASCKSLKRTGDSEKKYFFLEANYLWSNGPETLARSWKHCLSSQKLHIHSIRFAPHGRQQPWQPPLKARNPPPPARLPRGERPPLLPRLHLQRPSDQLPGHPARPPGLPALPAPLSPGRKRRLSRHSGEQPDVPAVLHHPAGWDDGGDGAAAAPGGGGDQPRLVSDLSGHCLLYPLPQVLYTDKKETKIFLI